jgi:hypothetical protein
VQLVSNDIPLRGIFYWIKTDNQILLREPKLKGVMQKGNCRSNAGAECPQSHLEKFFKIEEKIFRGIENI